MDAIIIEGLKVETVVGCFNWERQIIQPLMLDMTIQTSLEQASHSDELQHTLNYAEICEISATVIQKAQILQSLKGSQVCKKILQKSVISQH